MSQPVSEGVVGRLDGAVVIISKHAAEQINDRKNMYEEDVLYVLKNYQETRNGKIYCKMPDGRKLFLAPVKKGNKIIIKTGGDANARF